MTNRERNGIMLAAVARIIHKGGVWVVPSQTQAGKSYLVDLGKETCTCPDRKELGNKCKHLHAAEIVARREAGQVQHPPEPVELPEVKKKSYGQNWPAYNLAQSTEKHRFQSLLHDLCKPLVNPPRTMAGRPRIPLSDIVFAVVFKIYSTTSYRRFACDLKEAQEKGYIRELPHFNALCRYLLWDSMTQVLLDMIEQSSLPLRSIEVDFAVDSTGFSTSRFVRWYDEKYGMTRTGHDWVKVHLMVGVKTNVVTAVEIRGRTAADSPLYGRLLDATARNFSVREVAADKAYSTVGNIERTFRLGATPYIPFKANASGLRGGAWEKMLLYYQLHREEFLAHYHKRSNVESTFAMIKAKFRDHCRSRNDVSMKNEALAKILCHNICCVIQSQIELGVEPVFWGQQAPSPIVGT